jgi:hypothetical protein
MSVPYIQGLLQAISEDHRLHKPDDQNYTGRLGNNVYISLGNFKNNQVHIHIYFNDEKEEGEWVLTCRNDQGNEITMPGRMPGRMPGYHEQNSFNENLSYEFYIKLFYDSLMECLHQRRPRKTEGIPFGRPGVDAYTMGAQKKYLKYKMKYLELKKILKLN